MVRRNVNLRSDENVFLIDDPIVKQSKLATLGKSISKFAVPIWNRLGAPLQGAQDVKSFRADYHRGYLYHK